MNRMRENTGVVLWILVLSFGGLWVLQDSGVFDTIGVDPLSKVIIVDGDPITFDVYNRQLQAQIDQVRQYSDGELSPTQLDNERERAFNFLVENKLREHDMDRIGLTVSEAEITDLILGPEPHAIIQANFASEGGTVNRELLQSVIDDPAQEGTWVQIEQFIRLDRRQQKFNQLLNATARISDADIEAAHALRTRTADVEFFFLRYADVPTDSVDVTERDIEQWYDENSDQYRRNRLYTLELAVRSKEPTADDTLSVLRELERLRPEFETTSDDSLFVARSGSEAGWSTAFLGASSFSPAIAAALFEGDAAPEPGQVIGPIIADNRATLIKVIDTRPSSDTHVRARHILARHDDSDSDAANQSIQSALQRLRNGEDFALVASEVSDDPGSGQNGGDLGWFGPGAMVEPFEEAAFNGAIGRVIGPVETDFGLHLIEVTHRADRDVQVARIAFSLDASVATLNANTELLEDLRYYAEEEGDFAEEAQRRDIEIQPMTLTEGQITIPIYGISRAIPDFLETAEVGEISPIIELDEWILVVHVTAIQPEGIRPLEEVYSAAQQQAELQAKRAFQMAKMQQAYSAGGFDGLSMQLGLPAQTASVGFEQAIVSGMGRDLQFAGVALSLSPGTDSGVIEGQNGAYVVRTTAISDPPELSDSERDALRTELLQQLERRVGSDYINGLRDAAKIEDLRRDVIQQ